MEYLTCNKRKDILTHVYIYDIKKSVYYDCINNAIITTFNIKHALAAKAKTMNRSNESRTYINCKIYALRKTIRNKLLMK